MTRTEEGYPYVSYGEFAKRAELVAKATELWWASSVARALFALVGLGVIDQPEFMDNDAPWRGYVHR